MKKLWSHLNLIIGNKKKTQDIVSLKVDKKTVTDKESIVNAFNDFFCKIAENLDKQLPTARKINTLGTNEYQIIPNSLYMSIITAAEVQNTICSLKNKHSVRGLDILNVQQLKWVADIICKPLADLFMEYIHFGNFPSVLKISKVIPILKSGSVADVNNYRPIALQSVLSKTFEKIIKKRLFAFF
jgi:hypothetical protein